MTWGIVWGLLVACSLAGEVPVRIGVPVGGHIHPAICQTRSGTLIVTYGRVNHVDLRISRSTDGGRTWSEPVPYGPTVGQTYYPGSLTALASGRVVHAWNRWEAPDNQREPRSVLYSTSDDDGLTWSAPQPFPRDPQVPSIIRHALVELGENDWLASLSDRTLRFNPTTGTAQPLGDGRGHGGAPLVRTKQGTFISGAGLRSTDGGATWQPIAGLPDVKTQWWRHELFALSNGWVLASEVLGPGIGGEQFRYVISRDNGQTWNEYHTFHNPGRAIQGRACPRAVELDPQTIGVVFYDIDEQQPGGPGVFFLRIPLSALGG